MKIMKIGMLLLAGSFFLSGCGAGTVKSGVTVNGVPVGEMPYEEAVREVRKGFVYLPLTVHSPAGDYAAPLDYSDNLESLLREAKRGKAYSAKVRREWISMEDFLGMVCRDNAKESVNASLSFDKNGFNYFSEVYGVACDYEALLENAFSALMSEKTQISLDCHAVVPEITVAKLRERTQLLAAFSTGYDPSNLPRSHNVSLATERIVGTVIESGGEFSFNGTVGARTEENGYEIAAVIQDGEFVSGVGGGVCQVSTTLFGAALRAGLEIAESRPHSLSVGYALPSQDAMVSEYSDLKLINPYSYPVYVLGSAEGGILSFSFYGMPDGNTYEVESHVLYRLEPPPMKVVEGSENRVVRAEREGLASESFRLVYDGAGNLLSRTLIRRDTYACVQGIEERVPERTEGVLEGG
ncbi:MAG: VanW family protein [Clostridia bacterium]|nr:VanW family protein [Clostridia bacterium]